MFGLDAPQDIPIIDVLVSASQVTRMKRRWFCHRYEFFYRDARKNPQWLTCDYIWPLIVLMQGLPAAPTFVLAPDSEDSMDCSGNSVKKRQEAKKSLLKYLERKCSTADKLFTVGSKQESNQEGILLLRHLSEQKRRGVNSLRYGH